MSATASFLGRATATFGTNVAVGVVSFANVLVVARSLGPTGRGDYVFLITVVTILAWLAGLGVHQANANLGSTSPGLRRALASNSLVLAAAFGLVAVLAFAGATVLFPEIGGDVRWELRSLALAAVPVLILQLYLVLLVQADYGFAVTNVAWLIPPVTNVVVNGLLALAGLLTVAAAIGVWVAGQAVATLVLSWEVGRRRGGFGRPHLGLAARMVRFGAKTHPARILTIGNYRLDQWLLGVLAGSRELGLYSIAVAWFEVLFYLPTVLATVQRPDLARASRAEAARRATLVLRATLMLTAALALAMIAAAPVLCVWFFGASFAGAIDDLRLLAPGAFGIAAVKVLGDALTAQRMPLRSTIALAVALLLTVVLDLVLIPAYGGAGAAAASTVAYAVGGILIAVVFAHALNVGGRDFVPRFADVSLFVRVGRRRTASRIS